MSTDKQPYSIPKQLETIALYALKHSIEIVRTYEDAGISGLLFEERAGLGRLIADVQSGCADFNTILVYDVSRWGRFQDCDESAHYEFICRQAGIDVEYCAEEFVNDGSLTANVLKSLKRAMASEYSRELSEKTFAGQRRLVTLGFHPGAPAGYGLRRCLLDNHGNPRKTMEAGERKYLHADRVILVPGPAEETETVREIFRLFVEKKKGLEEIARELNAAGCRHPTRRRWAGQTVKQVLINERFIGNNIYNRRSAKLRGMVKPNPPHQWIRATGVIEPIISKVIFQKARARLAEIGNPYTEAELLDSLTALWCVHGVLSVQLVQNSKYTPSQVAYRRCFGNLMNAYSRIGYCRRVWSSRAKNLTLRQSICFEIEERVRTLGGSFEVLPGRASYLVNKEFSASVLVLHSCRASNGTPYWRFWLRVQRKPDIAIVVQMNAENTAVRDYFIAPFPEPTKSWRHFTETSQIALHTYRFPSLEMFFGLCARTSIAAPPREQRKAARQKLEAFGPSENRLAAVVLQLRAILSDGHFVRLLHSEGVRSMPRLLATDIPSDDEGPTYGQSVLEVIVAAKYVARLSLDPRIQSHLKKRWPKFSADLQSAFDWAMSQDPFAPHRNSAA